MSGGGGYDLLVEFRGVLSVEPCAAPCIWPPSASSWRPDVHPLAQGTVKLLLQLFIIKRSSTTINV